MLDDVDVAPIVTAIDDRSPRVRRAALKVIALLLPRIRGGSVYDRLEERLASPDEDVRALARDALDAASRSTPSEAIDEDQGDDAAEPDADWAQAMPERWREIVAREGNAYRRLDAALKLAAVGDTAWLETVVDDIERAPWDLEELGRLRDSERPPVPAAVAQRFLALADDATRRGDVRQLAYLLGRGADQGRRPPDTPDLAQHAAAFADEYLQRHDQIGVGWRDTEALRYVDPARASLLVTVSFARCVEAAFSRDMGYAVGNDIGAVLSSLGNTFSPDVRGLFDIYIEMRPFAAASRTEWYKTRDDDVVFRTTGHLAVSWQLAWTLGRLGLVDSLAALGSFIDPAEPVEVRLAALELLEDLIRFLPRLSFPLYGGVTEPEMDSAIVVGSVSAAVAATGSTVGYRTVRVFYGTNRRPTGVDRPSHWYGIKSGDLELGSCEVSIPDDHKIGKLESPSPYSVNWHSNPGRFVVLMRVARLTSPEFCEGLRQAVARSTDRQLLVFVHGYRVSFEDAARRTAQLGEDLDIAAPVLFSWPSQGRLRAYGADAVMAERSVPRLVEFLDLVAAESSADVVHLIAHSMGSVALSKAVIEYLATRRHNAAPKIRELILAAPDIDAEIFSNQIAPKIAGRGPRMTVYASRRDYALLASRWLRSGLSRAGFIEGTAPLVVPGVETVDVSAVNTECLSGLLMGHSYVGDRPEIVQDMYELLRFGKNASERFGNRPSLTNGSPYWIMKPRSA